MPRTGVAPRARRGLVATLAAIAVLAGCGGGDAADRGAGASGAEVTATAPPTTTPPATTARRPEPLGRRDHRLALTVDGQRRRFLLHTPPGHRRGERLPLVVALHMVRDDTDDVGFVRALVDHARRRWGADPDRVYATGASNGAAMSYRLAAALPGVLAAIAPVSGALTDIDVPEGFPTSPVSLVAFTAARTGCSPRWIRAWPPGGGGPAAGPRRPRPMAAAAR